LANAEVCSQGGIAMRYIVVCDIHRGIEPNRPIRILDAVDGKHIYVLELLERLSEGNRRVALYS